MKKTSFSFVVMVSLVFVACNKDEEIVRPDDNPGNNDYPAISLNYSVVEYTPAPGQYINEKVSGFNDIFTPEAACRQAEQRLAQNLYVSLGGWGGYIVVKLNEKIPNSGDYDFGISSNSFDSSNEPGIVWVMQDLNQNGIPDDTWYELKGSHFGKEGYERNYWVTYTKPDPKGNTLWEDSNGETGMISWLGYYHNQDFYYPNWIEGSSYTLFGSRLPSQIVFNPENNEWKNLPFEWGYADNMGEDFLTDNHVNQFRIADAVDSENKSVDIKFIDFIKVQTAVNASSGWLGENSTEITGFILP